MENTRTDPSTTPPSDDNAPDKNLWFVLRDLSRPNAKIPGYKLLEKEKITFFTPMHYVIKKKNGKNTRIKEPVLKSLLFAYTCKEILDALTCKYRVLQFRYMYGHSINDPMIVPKEEMDRFIHAIESSYSEPIYYSMEDITPDKYGKEVRIIGGNLDGYTGRLLRARGSKVKRLLVELKGLFVAGVEVDAEYIQFV